MKIKQAATDVVNRWYSPKWKDQEATVACNPMDYEQIEQEFFSEGGIAEISQHAHLKSFTFGVRFAEKMHGVTEDCKENE